MTDFFAHLDEAPVTASVTTDKLDQLHIANGGTKELRTCPKCHGLGSRTYGYVNIKSYPCSMCQTTGKVTEQRIKAVNAAAKGKITAENNLRERRHAFQEAHKVEVAFIHKCAEFSDFYRSLSEQLVERGTLSDNQLAAVRRGIEKSQAKREERTNSAPSLDVSRIEALFDQATASKLKRPMFRAMDGVVVSKAPETGCNAGALYVKENGEYAGKIVQGRFMATQTASEKVLPRLQAIAADPAGQATLYGQQTGVCGCCGAELTNKESIEKGIGPICASKWGL